jgi:hypothetical protein
MFSIVINGSQVTVNDFATMIKTLFSKLDERSLRRFPRRVVPQSNWVTHYYLGKGMIALPPQIRHFCLTRGVTQSGKLRLNARPLSTAEVSEFFRSCDRFNRGLFGEKLHTDKSATRIVLSEPGRFDVLVGDERIGRGFKDFIPAAEAMFGAHAEKSRRLTRTGPWFAVMCYRLNGSYLILNHQDVLNFCYQRGLLEVFDRTKIKSECFIKEPDLNNYFVDMDRHNRQGAHFTHQLVKDMFKRMRAN